MERARTGRGRIANFVVNSLYVARLWCRTRTSEVFLKPRNLRNFRTRVSLGLRPGVAAEGGLQAEVAGFALLAVTAILQHLYLVDTCSAPRERSSPSSPVQASHPTPFSSPFPSLSRGLKRGASFRERGERARKAKTGGGRDRRNSRAGGGQGREYNKLRPRAEKQQDNGRIGGLYSIQRAARKGCSHTFFDLIFFIATGYGNNLFAYRLRRFLFTRNGSSRNGELRKWTRDGGVLRESLIEMELRTLDLLLNLIKRDDFVLSKWLT